MLLLKIINRRVSIKDGTCHLTYCSSQMLKRNAEIYSIIFANNSELVQAMVWLGTDGNPDDKAVRQTMNKWTCIGALNKHTKILFHKQLIQPPSLSIPSVLRQRPIIRCQWDGHRVQIVRISNRIDQSLGFIIIVPRENRWLLMTRQSPSLHNRKSWVWTRYIDLSSELPCECDILRPYFL